jgi:hypothetical protein
MRASSLSFEAPPGQDLPGNICRAGAVFAGPGRLFAVDRGRLFGGRESVVAALPPHISRRVDAVERALDEGQAFSSTRLPSGDASVTAALA